MRSEPADIATNAPSVQPASPRAFLIVFDDLNLSPAGGCRAWSAGCCPSPGAVAGDPSS